MIPLVVLAALATIIASQALISGVFSMTRQAIQMGLCPRSKIVPTSSDEAGQVHLPTANWLLMAGTLLVVVMFKTSDALASAYGIAVSGTMLVTTIRVFHERVALLGFVPDRRPRVPFGERHTVENIGHGFYRVRVRLGFMQTPDIPLTLQHIQLLGFDADLERKHYYLAHETVVRRDKDSAMGPVSFAIFAFLSKISSRAPDYFKIPHDGVIEVGFRIEI